MSDEKQKRNEFSTEKSEGRILPRNNTPIDSPQEEPTRQFTASVDDSAQTAIETAIENSPDTEPTKVLEPAPQNDETARAANESLDENALRPSRLRFTLVCLLFVFVIGVNVINLIPQLSFKSSFPEFNTELKDKRQVVDFVDPKFADRIQIGDELLGINNEPVNDKNLLNILVRINEGERYTLQLNRGSELREAELVAQPIPFVRTLERYLVGIFLSATFLLTGLAIFLLKPNDKQALLTAVLFAVLTLTITPKSNLALFEMPLFFTFLWRSGAVVLLLLPPLLTHLFLVFPERSRLARRFPKLEWLIYLPFLLIVMPYRILWQLKQEGWTQFDLVLKYEYLDLLIFIPVLYTVAALALLLFNYLKADETSKRRIRLLVVGFTVALVPILVYLTVVLPLVFLRVAPLPDFGDWGTIIIIAPMFLMPLSFAYAIVRHKVIPVSFVVRRGLQYLLAKNALHVLVILPILGILWNVASNPNRTLGEILLNNSFAFYSFIALAVGFFLLMRSRFSVWIDKRFFREQYNQEKLIRELIDDVKQSDSMPKMSRLVSSRIQSAIHPQSVYLFYEDAQRGASDFSTGYTTSEDSDNLKLAADSPLLRFMQKQRGAIDFPLASDTTDLPACETAWLRSIGANLLVPMHGTDGKLAGFFVLGEKMSEIPYTGRDKELLETLATQIALVNENLSLKDRVRREQRIKTEVLSRFDEGNINLLKECPACGKCFDRNDEKCDADNSELTISLPVERTIENRYRLERLLGKGGMGAVYEATDLRINRTVAVKILSGAMFGNKDALRRFEREAQTAGKLNHPNIVTVFDYGVLSTKGAFLVMELVEGETLTEILRRKGKLGAETVAAWLGQVLDGVEAAHKAGIIHRDLKPDNIFVTRNQDETVRLCILDFGLARFNDLELAGGATVPGTVMGTLGYMPPEQLRGEKTDETSDLFAAGVIIYEALHGRKPFAGKTYQEITQSMNKEILFDEREPFAEFFERGLAQKPENRFATASEMKRNLLAATN